MATCGYQVGPHNSEAGKNSHVTLLCALLYFSMA